MRTLLFLSILAAISLNMACPGTSSPEGGTPDASTPDHPQGVVVDGIKRPSPHPCGYQGEVPNRKKVLCPEGYICCGDNAGGELCPGGADSTWWCTKRPWEPDTGIDCATQADSTCDRATCSDNNNLHFVRCESTKCDGKDVARCIKPRCGSIWDCPEGQTCKLGECQ